MLRCVELCCVAFHCIVLPFVTSCCAAFHGIVAFHCVVLHSVVFCCIVLCCVAFRCVVLCCILFCYAVVFLAVESVDELIPNSFQYLKCERCDIQLMSQAGTKETLSPQWKLDPSPSIHLALWLNQSHVHDFTFLPYLATSFLLILVILNF